MASPLTPQHSLKNNLIVNGDNRITYFAQTDSRNRRIPFGIKREDRSRHTYVIGKTGMGKSTLLENMAIQDIQNGEGLTFIDPHGSTAEKLLEYVPAERVKDVLYFAPFDLEYPISFNILENVDADKRHFVISGLMSTFEKIWVDAWSARMAYILQNTLAALLEFPGATLLGVNRMYIDKDFRKRVVANITDPSIKSFWEDEYTKFTDRYTQEATPAIQNKIGQFASNALVRNIIGQPTSAFDVREMMDNKKIFIINLSKGRVGENNANLLGSMLITKIYLAAMSRADSSPVELQKLPDSYLYVDEFQNFANKSFADILSEARKYKLSLTIAHQYIEQMEEEVRAAVFGNVGTMITFRVGSFDATILEKEFAPAFTATDIVNLDARQIYLKLMIDGVSSQPFSATTIPPIEPPRASHRDMAIAYSRKTYAKPRAEVQEWIRDWVEGSYAETKESAKASTSRESGRETNRPENKPEYKTERRSENRGGPDGTERRASSDRRESRAEGDRPRSERGERAERAPRSEKSAEDLRATLASLSAQSNTQANPRTEKKPDSARDTKTGDAQRQAPERAQNTPQRARTDMPQEPRRDSERNRPRSMAGNEHPREKAAPLPPERDPQDLRNILARLRDKSTAGQKDAPKNIQKTAPSGSAPDSRRPAEKVPSGSHAPQADRRPQHPSNEASVTSTPNNTNTHLDDLRSQLAKLSAQPPQIAPQQKQQAQTLPQQAPEPKRTAEQADPQVARTNPSVTQKPPEAPTIGSAQREETPAATAAIREPNAPPPQNREIPEDVLRKLLYVDPSNP